MSRRRGFTLIEVMISMAIFATSVTAAFVLYTVIGRMDDSSRHLTQAMNDGRLVMEAIRNRAQANGLGAPSGVTAFYPAGANLMAPGGRFAELGLGPPPRVEMLPVETITVTYAGGDPLQVTVRVSWSEEGRLPLRFIELQTLMTTR